MGNGLLVKPAAPKAISKCCRAIRSPLLKAFSKGTEHEHSHRFRHAAASFQARILAAGQPLVRHGRHGNPKSDRLPASLAHHSRETLDPDSVRRRRIVHRPWIPGENTEALPGPHRPGGRHPGAESRPDG